MSETYSPKTIFRTFLAIGVMSFGTFAYYHLAGPGSAAGQQRLQEKVERDAQQSAEYRAAEKKLEDSRKAGAAALAAADDAIRSEAADRRQRLEKASKSIRTTNSNGVRVDQYILKKGGIVSCTTTISGNAPAMFNCDGDV